MVCFVSADVPSKCPYTHRCDRSVRHRVQNHSSLSQWEHLYTAQVCEEVLVISSSAVHLKSLHQTDHILCLDMLSLQRLPEAQVLH